MSITMKLSILLVAFLSISFPSLATNNHSHSLYIVLMNNRTPAATATFDDQTTYYLSFLSSALSRSEFQIFHTYKTVATGFSAKLTSHEADILQHNEHVLYVKPQKIIQLHTTHSPAFLGLNTDGGVWPQTNYGRGVIIGLVDTGIASTHLSFNDDGMSPPPTKWKGKCEFGACNKKLIGYRKFCTPTSGDTPPVSYSEYHGTHTSSTAAGNFVKGANVFGDANGTAAGIAPLAHLAMYAICSDFSDSDVLAAMDKAVEDGVDILSLSLSVDTKPLQFYDDAVAIGAYGAIRHGVFVACSAGNEGPLYQSLVNDAPWILTVGASTIDRALKATVKLGNSHEFDGESLLQPQDFPSAQVPLISSCDSSSGQLNNCTGKILVSNGIPEFIEKGSGAVGIILMNEKANGYCLSFDNPYYETPACLVTYSDGLEIQAYMNSTENPTATFIFKGTVIGDATAPAVAYFSSRGPSFASPGVLKPDIIGPGVNILGAWPYSVDNNTSEKSATFNIASGTSMSCPHLAGVAAILKSAHPGWTPAAIKSAIRTTADQYNMGGTLIMDETRSQADIFATGSGHVNPSRANDPGLVYDIHPKDYIPYLCGLNYTAKQISVIVHEKVNCSELKSIPEGELNYPSFGVIFDGIGGGSKVIKYTRTLTNVGSAGTYKVDLASDNPVVRISVEPATLSFKQANEKKLYTVTFTAAKTMPSNTRVFGRLEWSDGKHVVGSPIAVSWT